MSIAPSTLPAPMSEIRQPRAYVEFCRQQPLGTISFAIICAMMIAGIFCEWVAPYDPWAVRAGLPATATVVAPHRADPQGGDGLENVAEPQSRSGSGGSLAEHLRKLRPTSQE